MLDFRMVFRLYSIRASLGLIKWCLLLTVLLLGACSSDDKDTAQKIALTTPKNILAKPGTRAVLLSWGGVRGAITYTVYWSNQAGVNTRSGNSISTNIPFLEHTELSNGVPYYYVITSTGTRGESSASVEVNAQPEEAAPAAPLGVTAQAGDARVRLVWEPVAGANQYRIFWNKRGTVGVADSSIDNVISPFVHSSLANGDNYFYVVVAENAQGLGTESTQVQAQPKAVIPTAPIITAATVDTNSVLISWQDISATTNINGANDTRYDLFWNTTGNVSTADTQIRNLSSPYRHLPLNLDQDYYYRIQARNNTGSSELSNMVRVRPPTTVELSPVGVIPATPGIISVGTGSGQLSLSWDAVPLSLGYNLYWTNSPTEVISKTADASIIHKISNIKAPYTHIQLNNGSEYRYALSAINNHGESALSAVSAATPLVITPGVPAGLRVSGGDEQIAISWLGVDKAQAYRVYITDDLQVEQIIDSVTSHVIVDSNNLGTALVNGKTYRIEISAINFGINSPRGEVQTAIPQEPPPLAPTRLNAEPSNANVRLSWSPALPQDPTDQDEDVLSYHVYYGFQAGVTRQNGNLIPATNNEGQPNYNLIVDAQGLSHWQLNHTQLNNGQRYYYIVSAKNIGGESRASNGVWARPQIDIASLPNNIWAEAGDNQVVLHFSTATDTSDNSHNLYWSKIIEAGADSVSVRSATQVITNIVPGYVFQDGDSNGNTYFFRLSAVNAAGESNQTSEVSARPQIPAPQSAPQNLASVDMQSQVRLIWDSIPDATQYVLYWSTEPDIDTEVSSKISGSDVQSGYVHSGLNNGQVIYYRIAGVNAGGEGVLSKLVTALPRLDAPLKPNNLVLSPADTQIFVNWPLVASASSYTLFWHAEPIGTDPLQNWSSRSGAIPGSSVKGLINAQLYHFRLLAHNAGGTSLPSEQVSAAPEQASPATPSGLTVAAGDAQLVLNWSTTLDHSYTLYWSADAAVLPIDSGNQITDIRPAYTHSEISAAIPLSNGVTYYYQLTSTHQNNLGGESVATAVVQATPAVAILGAPQALRAEAGDAEVLLNWLPPISTTGPNNYTLYWSNVAGQASNGTAISNLTNASYTHSGLSNNQTYYYVVTATPVVGGAESLASLSASANPKGKKPAQIVGAWVTPGNAQNLLGWQADALSSQYKVEWSTQYDVVNNQLLGTVGQTIVLASSTQFLHANLNNNETIYYQLSGENNNGEGGVLQTGPASVVISGTPQIQTNQTPQIIEGTPLSVDMDEDGSPKAFSLTLNANDNDADFLNWRIANIANDGVAAVTGNNVSALVSYSPTAEYFGGDQFIVEVDDGRGGTDRITIDVVITAQNDAPVFNFFAAPTSLNGASINISASATDIDNSILAYTASNLPPGLVIDSTSGQISGVISPTASAGSPYNVSLSVDDQDPIASAQDNLDFTWTVVELGADPSLTTVIIDPVAASVDAGSQISMIVTARDVNEIALTSGGNIVALTITGANANLTAAAALPAIDNNDGTYTLSYTANIAGVDTYVITLEVAGNPVAISGNYTKTIRPLGADIAASSVSSSPPGDVTVGNSVNIELLVRDNLGNPTNATTVVMSVANANPQGLTPSNPVVGTYQASYVAATAGVDDYSVIVNGLPITLASKSIVVGNVAPSDITLVSTGIAENSLDGSMVGTLDVADSSGDVHTFSFVPNNNNANGRFSLVNNELRVANGSLFDYETNQSHLITVQVTDQGNLTFIKDLSVTINDVNDVVPVINNTGLALDIAENNTFVAILVVDDIDTVNAAYTYTLSGSDAIHFEVQNNLLQFKAANTPDYEIPADLDLNRVYDVSVAVNDGVNDSAVKTFTLTITDVAEAVLANSIINITIPNAAPDITAGDLVELDLQVRDINNQPTDAVVTMSISGANFNKPLIPSRISLGDYKASYTAEITGADTYSIFVDSLIVTPSPFRIIISGAANLANSTSTITPIGPATVGDSVVIELILLDDFNNATSAEVLISVSNANTFTLTPVNPATGTYRGSYNPVNGGTDDYTVTINSAPVAIPSKSIFAAPTNIALSNALIPENSANGTIVGQLTTTDTVGDIITYSFVAPNNDAGLRFGVDVNDNLIVLDGSRLDFETSTSHLITVQAQDQSGLTFSKNFTISLSNVNDTLTATNLNAPEFFIEGNVFTLTPIVVSSPFTDPVTASLLPSVFASGSLLMQNLGLSVVITNNAVTGQWNVSGSTVDVTSVLAAVTYTNGPLYVPDVSIAVTISDGIRPALTGNKQFNMTPIAAIIATSNVVISPPSPAAVGDNISIDVQVRDAANNPLDVTLNISVSGANPGPNLAISNPLPGNYSANYIANNAGEDNYVVLINGSQINTLPHTIGAPAAPTDIKLSNRTIPENSAGGSLVGVLSAIDNAGDAHTYQFVAPNSNAGGLFTIVGDQIQVSNGLGFNDLNYDSTNNSFLITVRATDQSTLSVDVGFRISLMDLNDITPQLFNPTLAISIPENRRQVIELVLSDKDSVNQPFVYTFSGEDAALFEVDNLMLQFKASAIPDFELPGDVGPTNSYNVGVSVNDGVNQSGVKDFVITVTDLLEDPALIYYVSDAAQDDTADGLTPLTPKKTINAAIAAAILAAPGAPADIRVAVGHYKVDSSPTVNTHIVLKDRVSLYGGYTLDFSKRLPKSNATIIEDISNVATGVIAQPSRAIDSGDGISPATVVDGFTIRGSSMPNGDFSAAIRVYIVVSIAGQGPTIRNNIIYAGYGSLHSTGIWLLNSSSLIENNIIHAGTGEGRSWGIYSLGQRPVIRSNQINGRTGGVVNGAGANISSGISAIGAAKIHNNKIHAGCLGTCEESYGIEAGGVRVLSIEDNIIYGGGGTLKTVGISVANAQPTIRRNTIYAGDGAGQSIGIDNTVGTVTIGAAINISNNIIHGGRSLASVGIQNSNIAFARIRNNIIDGGFGSVTAYGISNLLTTVNPHIDNNIISTTGSSTAYCIFEEGGNVSPKSLRNNNLYNCGTAIYFDADAGCGGANTRTCTLSQMQALEDIAEGVSGNVSTDPLFIDKDGHDNDITTLEDNDWRFSGVSPSIVSAGGLNGFDNPVWGYVNDNDGALRPASGNPWGMGAFDTTATFYVSAGAANDAGDGRTPLTAKLTINAAIAAATAPAIVRVNAGTFLVNSDSTGIQTHVVMKEGVSLSGGHSASFSNRDADIHISAITDVSGEITTGSNPSSAIEAGPGISRATHLEGFTINASGTAPVEFSTGVLNNNAALVITNNIINGGAAAFQSNAIYNAANSDVVIKYNQLNGGPLLDSSGVYSQSSSHNVQYNVISAGHGVRSSGAGNYQAIIENNLISARVGGIFSANGGHAKVHNNTMHISGAYAIQIFSGAFASIKNNIMMLTPPALLDVVRVCVKVRHTISEGMLMTVHNNNLSGCTTAFEGDLAVCTTVNDGDTSDFTCSLSDMESLSIIANSSSENIPSNPTLVNLTGPDSDVSTMNDNDWHLQPTSPIGVREGGLDLSENLTIFDKDRKARTILVSPPANVNAAGWSMGAYEQD
ncbi:MAG: Ig-like domain-containing protein [Thiohalomonadales bacterium]